MLMSFMDLLSGCRMGSNLVLSHTEIRRMVLRRGVKCLVHYEQSIPAPGTSRCAGGRRRESIFLGSDDYLSFAHVLEERSLMWNVRIVALCLMPNHYHLLMQTPDVNH